MGKDGRAGGKAASNGRQNGPSPSFLTSSRRQSKKKLMPQRPQAPVISNVFTMLVYVPRSHYRRPGYKAQTRRTKVLVRVTCSGRARQKHTSTMPCVARRSEGGWEWQAGVKSRRSRPRGRTRGLEEGRGLGHTTVCVEEPSGTARAGACGQGSGVCVGVYLSVHWQVQEAARRCVWLVKVSNVKEVV